MGNGPQSLSLTQWHERYRQQGKWSETIRDSLFKKAQINEGHKILEVGSGTGAILELLSEKGYKFLAGVDIDYHGLVFSKRNNNPHFSVQGDGFHLPFKTRSFDVSFCQYLLLWVKNPAHILSEMCRVTKPSGCVIALAEPDHEARVDFPPPLDHLGITQTLALQDQGVDIQMGRKLRGLFHDVGLLDVQSGILGAQWSSPDTKDPTEWQMLKWDLDGVLGEDEFSKYKQLNHQAWIEGKRVLFVPTFYAIGKTPG